MLAVWVHITRGKLLMFHIAEGTLCICIYSRNFNLKYALFYFLFNFNLFFSVFWLQVLCTYDYSRINMSYIYIIELGKSNDGGNRTTG